ncbi:hypothetical protein N4G40_17380, partial [Pantoea eucrina]
ARAPHGGQGNCHCHGERKMHRAPRQRKSTQSLPAANESRTAPRASEKAHQPLHAAKTPLRPVAKAQASASGPFTH